MEEDRRLARRVAVFGDVDFVDRARPSGDACDRARSAGKGHAAVVHARAALRLTLCGMIFEDRIRARPADGVDDLAPRAPIGARRAQADERSSRQSRAGTPRIAAAPGASGLGQAERPATGAMPAKLDEHRIGGRRAERRPPCRRARPRTSSGATRCRGRSPGNSRTPRATATAIAAGEATSGRRSSMASQPRPTATRDQRDPARSAAVRPRPAGR